MFFGILIFIFSIGIGYFYSSLWKKDTNVGIYENEVNESKIAETYSEEEKVSYNASFATKKYYNECGHFKFQYSELPTEIINLTKSELEESYPEWDVEEFSKNNVVLSQQVNNICDEHYVLKFDEEQNISVYHIGSSGNIELYKTTNISKQYLTSTDIDNLENGIYVYGTGNLNSAIEDFE